MKVLIVGINGFVGTNLIEGIRSEHSIYGLDIVSLNDDRIIQTFGWNELESIPLVDVVIHLAGKAHDTRNLVDATSYFTINTGLTQKIFDWYLTSGAKKFIFFSSVKAVADTVTGSELLEEAIPNPLTPYGKSKLAAEQYILEEVEKYKKNRETGKRGSGEVKRGGEEETGRHFGFAQGEWDDRDRSLNTTDQDPLEKKVYILRPCMIHGPGNKGNLNLLFKLVSKGIPWPLGAYENKRSFTSIGNLQFVVKQILEKEITPGIYQLADDQPISTNRLIELIAASQGKSARIWPLNPGLINLVAKSGNLLHLPLNSERLKKLTESYVVSNKKIKQALGIEKMPIQPEEGMRNTLESF